MLKKYIDRLIYLPVFAYHQYTLLDILTDKQTQLLQMFKMFNKLHFYLNLSILFMTAYTGLTLTLKHSLIITITKIAVH